MTKTPWTPGPWRVAGKSVTASGSTDTYSGSVLGQIVECYDTEDFDSEGRMWSCAGSAEANARLIAAAPEMAALLQEALDDIDAANTSRWEYTARAILAKARGEDQ